MIGCDCIQFDPLSGDSVLAIRVMVESEQIAFAGFEVSRYDRLLRRLPGASVLLILYINVGFCLVRSCSSVQLYKYFAL